MLYRFSKKWSFFFLLILCLLIFPEIHSSDLDNALDNKEHEPVANKQQQNQLSEGFSKKFNSKITTNPACVADVMRICGKTTDLSDFDALECILNQKRTAVEELSNGCNDALWHYRKSITEEAGFLELSDSNCIDDFKKTGCWTPPGRNQPGFNIVNCIIDNKDKVEKQRCQTLVTRLEGVIFGDYEMIEMFASQCQKDIEKLKCGRNELDHATLKKLPHSQGKTIECLSERIDQLDKQCTLQILRVAELQTDDIHLDRALYFACRNDREKFCSRVSAGNGHVYKCLLRHKLESEMSTDCRDQIYRRQKLGWQDYKASGIVASCRDEIKKYKCRRRVSASEKTVRLSQILLCLENEFHKGQDVGGDCLDEIKQHRKALLQDFRLTPELLSACMEDKDKFCAEKGIHGKTLHCLMSHAQMRNDNERLSDNCLVELENLLKISDVSNDWQVDPVLQQNCQRVVDSSSCSKYQSNRVLDCLFNLLTTESGSDANIMTDDCEATLIQIQYFLARDFPLDSALFDDCSKDAQRICGAKSDWADDPTKMDPARGPIVLSCLFRNIASDDPTKAVSSKCANRVKETMRVRALSVHLLPDIEDVCMGDLTELCSDKTKPGEELQCLQTHLDELDKECRGAVSNFTELEMKNPTVDPFIWRHCREYIEDKCDGDKSEDEDDLLECLIDLKPEMKNKKCRISIEHLQLLKLKEIRFSPKFKVQCQSDVIRYCNGKDMQPLTSWKVVNCLSKTIRDDVITENTLRVSKGCRKQVRNLLLAKLQLESGISDVDSIYRVCSKYIMDLCSNVAPGGGHVLECLRDNTIKIPTDSDCHEALFRLEQETDADSRLDLILSSECSMEMKLFCNMKPDNMLNCLKISSNKEGFSSKCSKIVRERMMEQNSDARLNPRLHKSCKTDMTRFCSNISPGQGRILGCLKNVFVSPKNHLSDSCKAFIQEMMQHAAKEDIKYDADIFSACNFYVKQCQPKSSINSDDDDKDEPDKGFTEECLKQLYRDGKILDKICKNKVGVLVQSSMIDIHTDPMLNQACAIDLVRHCAGVPPGEGRLLKCLFAQLNEDQENRDKTHLSERCGNMLSKRSELFHLVGESNPGVESLVDIVEQVKISPQRNYLLTTGMSIVGLIFIFGLFCGRVTNRRSAEKNK